MMNPLHDIYQLYGFNETKFLHVKKESDHATLFIIWAVMTWTCTQPCQGHSTCSLIIKEKTYWSNFVCHLKIAFIFLLLIES